jgi:hypothetical protein
VKHKISDEAFIQAVKTSLSVRQVLKQFGLCAQGDAYKVFYRRAKSLNLDISHFTGQAWNRSKTFPSKFPLSDYLSNSRPICSYKLKNRLLKEKVFSPICSHCSGEIWLGNPMPLVLDHIDGNSDNNSIENLRLLCPNCHFLTPTFAGKNKGKKKTQV